MSCAKLTAAILGVGLIAAPVPAAAQFGGLAKKALGGGSSSQTSATNPDEFLSGALVSTKNVIISAALLAQALTNREDLTSRKVTVASVEKSTSFNEVNSHRSALASDLAALSERKDLAGDLTSTYQAGNAQQKKLIALAVSNLALAAYRNVKLAGDAPEVISSVGRNPQMMRRVGEFRTAGSLISMQAGGFAKIGSALPKVMSALKIPELSKAGTDKEMVASDEL